MGSQINNFWTNVAVGVLALYVGIDNLLRWMSDASFIRGVVIGTLCTILATAWLLFVFIKRSKE